MKKTLLTAALLTAFGVAAVAPQARAAAVSSGTITINGLLTASTCNVVVNGGTANATVTLPTVPLVNNNLSTAGSSAGWTAVTLTLSGCTGLTGLTSVYPYFTGTNIDASTGYLKNTGNATNVEVALSTTQTTAGALTLQNASGSQGAGTQSLTASNPTFSYNAGYVAVGGASTAGTVSTTVQYTLNYQ